jgi:hypothetical protein
MTSERFGRSIHAGSSSKSREKIAACWHCAPMRSSSGRPTPRQHSDARRFRRNWRGSTRIHGIENSGRRILGSNEIAYLRASYKTTFSSAEDSTLRQAVGSHLWILEKRADGWALALVSWSVWGLAAVSGTRQPPPSASAGSTS